MTPPFLPDEGHDGFPIEHLIDTSDSGSWARDLLHAQPCITISEYEPGTSGGLPLLCRAAGGQRADTCCPNFLDQSGDDHTDHLGPAGVCVSLHATGVSE